jgi:hypothetical protein
MTARSASPQNAIAPRAGAIWGLRGSHPSEADLIESDCLTTSETAVGYGNLLGSVTARNSIGIPEQRVSVDYDVDNATYGA